MKNKKGTFISVRSVLAYIRGRKNEIHRWWVKSLQDEIALR